jgi:ATP-dependent RNA helicase DHX29
MAPNKKKRKPVNNPARGFATVSTPSKKVDDSLPELQDRPGQSSVYGKPVVVGVGQEIKVAPGNEAFNLQHSQHMSPDELEHHLEEAELQILLDTHGQRRKKEIVRQIARLETERRSLRRGGIMLETESWLSQVLEDILELARSFLLDQKAIKTVEERPDDTALCVRLWTVQQTLLSLRFHEVDDVLKHLVKTFYLNTKTDSNSLVWGLDEAMNWLALRSNLGDLPAYQQEMNHQDTPPASRDRSPGFADASGETSDASNFPVTRLYRYLPSSDDTDSGTSSATSESQTKNEASDINPSQSLSDDSDDEVDDPDDLIGKFLSAKYKLLKSSLSSEGTRPGSQATGQQAHRLTRRIQKIERDVLFDRDEAMARWDDIKRDLEVEHARSNALAKRRKRPDEITLADGYGADAESGKSESKADDDNIGGDLFGNIFASDEKTNDDGDAPTAVTITLRDFGPLGAGGSPRKVLEEICKAR